MTSSQLTPPFSAVGSHVDVTDDKQFYVETFFLGTDSGKEHLYYFYYNATTNAFSPSLIDLGDVDDTLNDKNGNQLVVTTKDPHDPDGKENITSHYPDRYVSNTSPVITSRGQISRAHIVGVPDSAKLAPDHP